MLHEPWAVGAITGLADGKVLQSIETEPLTGPTGPRAQALNGPFILRTVFVPTPPDLPVAERGDGK